MKKIELPSCGIFIGSGVYPTDQDTLLSTMVGHYTWQAQHFDPLEMLDKVVEDKQGNLAQIWGCARGFSSKLRADWFYALDEIGIDVPAPDWENLNHLSAEKDAELFKTYQDRFGAGLVRLIREAKKRGLYTCFIYTNSEAQWIPEMEREGGIFYLGYDFGERYNIGLDDTEQVLKESGGELRLGALADRLIGQVREHVEERKKAGWGFVMATSANFHLDYEIYAGTDIPVVEDFAFPNLNFASAFSRGLYRQFDLPLWGAHLAHEHYSWLPNESPYRWKQLEAAFYLKYMAGSKMIINESGNWFVEHTLAPDSPKFKVPQNAREAFGGEINWGGMNRILAEKPETIKPYMEEARNYYPLLNYNSVTCRKYRKIIADFWEFVQKNGTPEGQPETTLALVKGNYDFSGSSFNPNSAVGALQDIADRNPNWMQGTPEKAWSVARNVFFPTPPVCGEYKNRHVSGTPFGQVDVISFAKDNLSADFLLKNYKTLLFTGWNTCSEKQYQTLLDYAHGGGTLFIGLPQLSTNETRNFAFEKEELVHGGDFSELCGLRIKGKGSRFYWATAPMGEDRLGFTLGRRFGIAAVPLADVEITDPNLEILVIEDELSRPVLTRHICGKGEVYYLNAWAYPGAFDIDDGPGAVNGSDGLLGVIYRYLAEQKRGKVFITKNGTRTGQACDRVAFSYFPDCGKICLYNIDSDQPGTFFLHFGVEREEITLAPGEFRVLTY